MDIPPPPYWRAQLAELGVRARGNRYQLRACYEHARRLSAAAKALPLLLRFGWLRQWEAAPLGCTCAALRRALACCVAQLLRETLSFRAKLLLTAPSSRLFLMVVGGPTPLPQATGPTAPQATEPTAPQATGPTALQATDAPPLLMELCGRSNVSIGRQAGSDVLMADRPRTVSRRHFELRLSGGAWQLCVLGRNGALLNGLRLLAGSQVQLGTGDQVNFPCVLANEADYTLKLIGVL